MKKELNRKIISICEDAGTAVAAEKCGELMDELDREYDKHVAAGLTELEAYREVSKRLDEIKKLVDSLPNETEEELAARLRAEELDRMEGFRTLKRITGKMSTVLWLSTVPVYLLYSMRTGRWATSWLIFLLATVSEIIINSVVDWNNETKDRRKTVRGLASSVLWLMTVVLYFVISFATGKWALTWMIFILATIIQQFFGKN